MPAATMRPTNGMVCAADHLRRDAIDPDRAADRYRAGGTDPRTRSGGAVGW